jgi:hypothetical protein
MTMQAQGQEQDQEPREQCPRCTEALRAFPEDIGAASRVVAEDQDVRICAACGMDEAMRVTAGLAPVPPGEWPVRKRLGFLSAVR